MHGYVDGDVEVVRTWSPTVCLYDAGFEQVPTVEELGDFGSGTENDRCGHIAAHRCGGFDHFRTHVRGEMRDDEVAAGGHGFPKPGQRAMGSVSVEEMQNSEQHDRDRLGEIERVDRKGE